MQNGLKIIECPRDAMQGIAEWIPTKVKTEYLNQLLKVGFHSLDFGSFVSPKAVPQMKDSVEIVEQLEEDTITGLLAIIVNKRGAEAASKFKSIKYLGYPLSISETFQWRNSRKTIEQSFEELKELHQIAEKNNKQMVVYVSMGFGNPYGDGFSLKSLLNFVEKIRHIGVDIISIADTTGIALPKEISNTLSAVVEENKEIEIGAHLHSVPNKANNKVKAVLDAGVVRIDGALGGYGGCPFAEDKLTGNIDTLKIIEVAEDYGMKIELNNVELSEAKILAQKLFSDFH